MKKTYLIIITAFVTLSCSTYKRDKFQYRNVDKKVWINTFKSEVFYSCISEGVKNDSLFKMIMKKDLLNIYDDYPIKIIDNARSLGKKIIAEMPKPYIKIDNDEEHLKNKNFISYSCLNYYSSRELDSIAKKAYKEYLNSLKD
jgi:hypothetical protein